MVRGESWRYPPGAVMGLVAVMLSVGACSESGPKLPPLPSVDWLVPYTSDANIPRHQTTDLDLDRAEKLLGIGEDESSLLKRTPFETAEQFQARGPAKLATLSPPVQGRSLFVFSVQAKMQNYDLATKTATFCVFDLLLDDGVEKKPGKDRVELSISSVAIGGRAYSRWTVLRFTNPEMKVSPVPLNVHLEPAIAEEMDASGKSRIAFVVSFGPPFRESGPVVVSDRVTRFETFTTTAIEARLERVVVYQPDGAVAGAVAF